MARKFRKKPVTIEAMQYTDGGSGERIIAWTAGSITPAFLADHRPGDGPTFGGVTLRVKTLESGDGSFVVQPDDWVIRGVSGEHYPCKPDIFEATYDPVDPRTPGDTIAIAQPGPAPGDAPMVVGTGDAKGMPAGLAEVMVSEE